MALSKTQNTRLGVILSIMAKEPVPESFLAPVVKLGFASTSEGFPRLTPKGLDEKNRLCTLAGLNIKYLSERNL